MAVKDFGAGAKEEQKNTAQQEEEKPVNKPIKEQEPTHQTEIKNAHASGDGSFGRSESSLPDSDEENSETNNPY